MRTKGPFLYRAGKHTVFRDVAPDTVAAFDTPDTAAHWLACHEAVESIGGDPETVGELVTKAQAVIDFGDAFCAGAQAEIDAWDELKALLAKLTEAKT